MKLSVLFLFIIPVLLYAQEFPLKSSTWYYTNNGGGAAPNTYLWKAIFKKDTLINGTNARIVTVDPNTDYGLQGKYIFRSSNDSVYGWTNQGNWGLLYVFNVKAGDTLYLNDFYAPTSVNYPFIVDSLDSTNYSGIYLKTYYLSVAPGTAPGLSFYNVQYTDRIGAEWFYPIIEGGFIPEFAVIRCYTDSVITAQLQFIGTNCSDGNPNSVEELSMNSAISITPTYSSGKISIESKNEKDFVVKVYDHHGRIVQQKEMKDDGNALLFFDNSIPDGLYFVNVETANRNFTKKVFLER